MNINTELLSKNCYKYFCCRNLSVTFHFTDNETKIQSKEFALVNKIYGW